MVENTQSVVSNIIKIRNDKRLGQQEMAASIGVSTATYSRIESQNVALTFDTLAKIANAFSMRVIDVITYPEVYSSGAASQTKVIVELDISQNEFIKMGLKDKVIQVLNK